MTTFWRQLSRDAHQISKYAGDVNAYQRGGVPRLAKRLVRRQITRRAFGLLRGRR